MITYPGDNLLDALLVTLHLQERLDLADGQVLPIAKGNQLIEGAKQLICILQDFPLLQGPASTCDNLGEEV